MARVNFGYNGYKHTGPPVWEAYCHKGVLLIAHYVLHTEGNLPLHVYGGHGRGWFIMDSGETLSKKYENDDQLEAALEYVSKERQVDIKLPDLNWKNLPIR